MCGIMSSFEDELIENVKKYPILYRCKEKTYKNYWNKEKYWTEIAALLNRTPEECKTKWRNIRDAYKKNKKKKITGGATVSKYNDERLGFLSEPYITHDESIHEEYDSAHEDHFAETLTQASDIFYTVQPITCTPTIADNVNSEDNQDPRAMKRKFHTILDEMKKGRGDIGRILHYLEESNSVERRSPTHKFFSSMADVVCKFPPEKIAEIRMRICSIVSETELAVLSGNASRIE